MTIDPFKGVPVIEEALKDVKNPLQEAWLAAYPDVAWVKQELLKAIVWCEANPRRRPKLFGRFMSSWLSRAFEDRRKSRGIYGSDNSRIRGFDKAAFTETIPTMRWACEKCGGISSFKSGGQTLCISCD